MKAVEAEDVWKQVVCMVRSEKGSDSMGKPLRSLCRKECERALR